VLKWTDDRIQLRRPGRSADSRDSPARQSSACSASIGSCERIAILRHHRTLNLSGNLQNILQLRSAAEYTAQWSSTGFQTSGLAYAPSFSTLACMCRTRPDRAVIGFNTVNVNTGSVHLHVSFLPALPVNRGPNSVLSQARDRDQIREPEFSFQLRSKWGKIGRLLHQRTPFWPL
jgi:hypothetical protein